MGTAQMTVINDLSEEAKGQRDRSFAPGWRREEDPLEVHGMAMGPHPASVPQPAPFFSG
jgi:hypothetical protein